MQEFDWRGIIEQTKEFNKRLRDNAEKGEWDRFGELSLQRDQVLHQLDCPALQTLDESESMALSAEIAALQRQNQTIQAISQRYLADIRQEHQQNRTNNRAINAYHRS
ncbi:flagellar protein FliT [Gilvimarinus agarilyticus]|uniref:flagellar protein FliT n=1 Tax=Gilvimarinus sp. 2_MG-2023 TaxID=3062666 RepID=UPI001C0842D4|nr:flagellar protein FliT [Gilvimarinus sp. 2_MG-2023]MBU2887249.1 flagellar protein FliT [Gilvimarinus agarilyticus]MDO6571908.1 flagellar protein FliT [Gilvimarinus sp. 2_MG-2023]